MFIYIFVRLLIYILMFHSAFCLGDFTSSGSFFKRPKNTINRLSYLSNYKHSSSFSTIINHMIFIRAIFCGSHLVDLSASFIGNHEKVF